MGSFSQDPLCIVPMHNTGISVMVVTPLTIAAAFSSHTYSITSSLLISQQNYYFLYLPALFVVLSLENEIRAMSNIMTPLEYHSLLKFFSLNT